MAQTTFMLCSPSNEENTKLLCKLLPPLVKTRQDFIPCGRGYFAALRKLQGNGERKDEDKEVKETFPMNEIIIPTNITINNLDEFSLYDVLGLGAWASSVDADTIKKAYHKAVLLYHPDKQQNNTACEEDARAIFLKIQEANTVLSNEDKRRAYDSQLDFDESIPTEEETREAAKQGWKNFYELYDPIFKLNARFASTKPVPNMGNVDASIQQVNSFYDYWVKFDSWRDFTNVNREHNPDSATSREEKRWMMKENERNAKKLKKKETSRINEMVMRAMEHDPRIVAEKERIRLEKLALKESREREVTAKAEAIAQKLADDTKAAENETQRMKLERENEKKFASKARNLFRKIVKLIPSESFTTPFTSEDVEILCQQLEAVKLSQLNDSFGGENAVKNTQLLDTSQGHIDQLQLKLLETKELIQKKAEEEALAREERKRIDLQRSRAADRKRRGLAREWTREELSTLAKAIGKFPGGTKQRWMVVCNYMNDILKPDVPYEMEECHKATHNAMEYLAQMKESGSIGGGKASTQVTSAPANDTPQSALSGVPTESSSINLDIPIPPVTSESATPPAAPVATAITDDADNDIWSQNQQQQLEVGLKKYPASMDKAERWAKISSEVTGKSKKACINRFKVLREEIQTKRTK